MKLLFIVQRYGLEVDGGAELYCRWLAERLSGIHEVTVLTTTARDYTTWANSYPVGESLLNGVTVIRKPVTMTRDIHSFNELTTTILSGGNDTDAEENWLKMQGPWSPDLLSYLVTNHFRYDLLIFVTYLYAPTVLGAKIAPEKSILIPTAHNEPVAHLEIFKDLYRHVAGLMYLTRQEQLFVENTYPVEGKPSILLGTGVDIPDSHLDADDIIERYQIRKPMLFYMGRVEAGKGCDTLIRYFESYLARKKVRASLVLAGRCHIPIPDNPAVICPGFIPDEAVKPFLLASDVVVVPSAFESLSILLLQAFACGRPVLANAQSPVLSAHCLDSNGGLFYANEDEFIESLDLLFSNSNLRKQLGNNGYQYIEHYYTWDKTLNRLENFCRIMLEARREHD